MTAAELRALIAGATPGEWGQNKYCGIGSGPSFKDPVIIDSCGFDDTRQGDIALIVALVNNAERFAELLAAEERGLWVSPVDYTGRWDFYRGTTHLGTVRQGMKLFDWVSTNARGYCDSLSEARAAVENAVRAGR